MLFHLDILTLLLLVDMGPYSKLNDPWFFTIPFLLVAMELIRYTGIYIFLLTTSHTLIGVSILLLFSV